MGIKIAGVHRIIVSITSIKRTYKWDRNGNVYHCADSPFIDLFDYYTIIVHRQFWPDFKNDDISICFYVNYWSRVVFFLFKLIFDTCHFNFHRIRRQFLNVKVYKRIWLNYSIAMYHVRILLSSFSTVSVVIIIKLLLQRGTVWSRSTRDVFMIWESFHFRSEL